MNQLLFDRSTGSLRPNAFARLQSTHLILEIQQSPNHYFDGGESSSVEVGTAARGNDGKVKACAHVAGINALVVDQFEGRL
jgi:DNA excision repair protein ERCC-8